MAELNQRGDEYRQSNTKLIRALVERVQEWTVEDVVFDLQKGRKTVSPQATIVRTLERRFRGLLTIKEAKLTSTMRKLQESAAKSEDKKYEDFNMSGDVITILPGVERTHSDTISLK